MSSISQLGSSVGSLQNRSNLGDYATLSERKEALQASQSKNLELSLTTKDGDTVTLSAGSFMEFSALAYDKSGRISNGSENASGRLSSREMTLASGSQFTFSVKGSLSEEEMDDIENIVKTLDDVINKMATGNMDDAVAKALEMQDGYENIAGFEANLSTSSSYSFEQAISKQEYYSDSNVEGREDIGNLLGGLLNENSSNDTINGLNQEMSGLNQEAGAELDVLKDSSSRLMDMMLKELEKLREENKAFTRKAAEPVDQLLSHHIESLKKSEESSENSEKNGGLLDQLANARKGMADEFRKMMPEAEDFRKIASSFFNV
ncbi:MAG: hypothetical protein HQK63_02630 [Desulfamplus sp.]|nr:hypothetical protein [Desulfamplus sp.]